MRTSDLVRWDDLVRSKQQPADYGSTISLLAADLCTNAIAFYTGTYTATWNNTAGAWAQINRVFLPAHAPTGSVIRIINVGPTFRGAFLLTTNDLATVGWLPAIWLDRGESVTLHRQGANWNIFESRVRNTGELAQYARTLMPKCFVPMGENNLVGALATFPALIELYVGDASNAVADWGYRCTNPSNPSGTRSVTGPFLKLPDAAGMFLRPANVTSSGLDPNRAVGTNQKGSLSAWDTGTLGVNTLSINSTGSLQAMQEAAGFDDYTPGDFSTGRVVGTTTGASTVALPGTGAEWASGTARPANFSVLTGFRA